MFDAMLKQRAVSVLLAVGILLAGVLAWQELPVDAFPDVTGVQVQIAAQSDGLSTEGIERLVTIPIEDAMGGLPGFTEVRSITKDSLALVTVVFEDDKDIDLARQEVAQRLDHVRGELPRGVDPEMGPKISGLGEVFQYTLEVGWTCSEHPEVWQGEPGTCPHDDKTLMRPKIPLKDLRDLQDWIVARQLVRLKGVTEINSFGGEVRQIEVLPDPDLLVAHGFTLEDVEAVIVRAGDDVGGGFIDDGEWRRYVVGRGRYKDPEDIRRLVLGAVDGTPVFLHQVAEVRIGHVPRFGAITRNGEGETVGGVVMLLQGANARDVVGRIHTAIEDLTPSLPAGVRILPYYDRTLLTDASVGTVSEALLLGGSLVIFVLLLFLWNLRAALVVALSLPLTASLVFLTMLWTDISANLMTLGGLAIAIGMIGDGAIVVVEAMVRAARGEGDRRARLVAALGEVARPVFFSILVIVAVLLPLFSLEGIEGKMFRPMAAAIAFAMLASLVVSLGVIPGLASFTGRGGEGPNPVERLLLAIYRPLLSLCLRWRLLVALAALGSLGGAIALVPGLGTEFMPALQEGTLTVIVNRAATASLESSTTIATWLERQILEEIPEVLSAVTRTGRPEVAIDDHGPDTLEMILTLQAPEDRREGFDQQRIAAEVARIIEDIPGATGLVGQPIEHRVQHMVSGVKASVAVKVFGEDLDEIAAVAAQVAAVMKELPGAADVSVQRIKGKVQLDVIPDRDALAPYGLDTGDVNELVEIGIGGRTVGTWYRGERRYPVRLRLPLHRRDTKEAMEGIPFVGPTGERVLLGDVAAVVESSPPAQIGREGFKRRVNVECNVRGRDLGSFVADLDEGLARVRRDLPTGVSLSIGGDFENQQRATNRLALILPVVLGLILILQLAALRSTRSTLLVLLNLPFSVVGGIGMIWLLGIHVSVSVLVGLIALFGMAVQHGTILVSTIDRRRADGATVDEAVMDASLIRLRPLLMTKLTSFFGLLPMLLASGPGADVQRPLAAVVLGGLLFTTLLNLFVVPAMYRWFHPSKEDGRGRED
ncbi:MAG: CusA/CzcA family heavy metal efflux RND transporter [Pseudomonadota bacterium]